MPLVRPFAVLLTGSLACFATSIALGQIVAPTQTTSPSTYIPTQPSFQQQPIQQSQLQQPQARQEVFQQQPVQQQPIRMQTLQTPPKSITHNGVTVYQQPYQASSGQGSVPGSTPGKAASERTMPAGFGSPYPTGTTLVATNQTDANRQPGAVYGMQSPPNASMTLQPSPQTPLPQAQPGTVSGPVAAVHPAAIPQTASAGGQPAQTNNVQLVHKGRSAPAKRVEPFELTPQERQELDEFLARWESYSEKIKRYEIDFTSYYYDPTIQRTNAADYGKPVLTTFGFFKYVAPSRFVLHIEGEWVNGKKVSRDKQGENEQPKAYAEKIIIDEKSVFYYDYNASTVKQINIPPEMIGKGIADSPLPLIFGAKAEDMKKRFYLKTVTADQVKDSQIWLQARPRFLEDQQEFLQIEIRLDKKTLRAVALKKDDINGQAHTVYVFNDPKVNSPFDLEKIREFFVSSTPRGWKHVVEDMPLLQAEQAQPNQNRPGIAPAVPHGNVAAPAQRNEIQLYNPQ